MYDLAIYIGRFQPFHLGHLHALEHASKLAKHTLVLIGSSFRPRTQKNPFLFHERAEMVMRAAADANVSVSCLPIKDFTYRMGKWVGHVQATVEAFVQANPQIDPKKIALVGHTKDQSSYYLTHFPEWAYEEFENYGNINATEIRESLILTDREFMDWSKLHYSKLLPNSILRYFAEEVPCTIEDAPEGDTWHRAEELLDTVRTERIYIEDQKEKWEVAPYPPIFSTVDAVIIRNMHILLVKRGGRLGNGLWALPGGFVKHDRGLVQSMVEEVQEETGMLLDAEKLQAALINDREISFTFDDPNRSARGRTITTAFLVPQFLHEEQDGLPEVAGGDDAADARWVPVAELTSENMFEDHYDIIDFFVPLEGLK